MVAESHALGTPRSPGLRGGDCRARDGSATGRADLFGPHRFATSSDCRITNGMLRVIVGVSGSTPSFTLSARRGRQPVDDTYSDTYSDTYGGSTAAPEWLDMGSVFVDSPGLASTLSFAALVEVNSERVIIRLASPELSDVYLTLRRGESHLRIQHGSSRPPSTELVRRVRWSPTVAGDVMPNRVVESDPPEFAGLLRYLGSMGSAIGDTSLSLETSGPVEAARMGAGVATYQIRSDPTHLHRQLADGSKPRQVF